MAKQTFTSGNVLTAAQMTSLQQTAMLGGAASAKVASYVLVAADAGTTVSMNNASGTTITVNTGLFAAGDIVTILNVGAGTCTITAGTATVSKPTNATLALVTNAGGVLYFTATGAATFMPFDVGSTSIPLTTKGDLFGYDTANARIPIGTNNQVLTADSTQALGLKWATASAAMTIAQIASGSMSGTSVTLSGLSSYDYLYLKLNGATASTAQPQLIRINNSSSNVYRTSGNLTDNTGTITRYDSNYGTEIDYSNSNAVSAGNTGQRLGIAFTNCKSAGFTTYQANGGQIGTTTYKYDFNGIYLTAEAVSSLVISCNGGTFNGGTYVLWGA
jgi:hypothetical protein